MTYRVVWLALASGLMLPGGNAWADEEVSPVPAVAEQEKSETLPLWELGAGAVLASIPNYPAAEDVNLRALPFPIVIYRGRFLRAGDGSVLSGVLFSSDRLTFDVSLNGSFDADSDDVEVRRGLPDLGYLFELGPELEWQLNDPEAGKPLWKLEIPLRAAFSIDSGELSGRGYVFNPELEYEHPGFFGADTELSLSLATSFASARLMDYFYTVEPQFATAERPAFTAGGGYLGSSVGITVAQRRGKRFAVAGLRLFSHHGAENDASPLFRDEFTWGFYAAIGWSLWESERRAPP